MTGTPDIDGETWSSSKYLICSDLDDGLGQTNKTNISSHNRPKVEKNNVKHTVKYSAKSSTM
jgi:hypothetical protein